MTPWIVLIYICYPIGVLGQEKSDAGQPDPPNQPEAKYPSGVAGFSLVCFTHTYIYMYSTGVWAEISTVNLHTFNAIAFYCNHSHRPQCRYITGPQDIYIYIQRYTHYICFIDCVSFTKTQMPFECPVTYLCLFSPRRHRM